MGQELGAALLMGLLGSVGHCVGMCGGVLALLDRAGLLGPSWLNSSTWPAHAGRLTTYGALGGLAGALGRGFASAVGLRLAQGALALLAALAALYFALVLWGVAPSPDRALPGAVRLWRRAFGRTLSPPSRAVHKPQAHRAYAAGLLWGLLPCGLVWMALPLALATGSAAGGALVMLAFGLGTLPALSLARLILQRGAQRWAALRRVAAGVVLLIGVQLALRALSAWGLVGSFRLGGLRLW